MKTESEDFFEGKKDSLGISSEALLERFCLTHKFSKKDIASYESLGPSSSIFFVLTFELCPEVRINYKPSKIKRIVEHT